MSAKTAKIRNIPSSEPVRGEALTFLVPEHCRVAESVLDQVADSFRSNDTTVAIARPARLPKGIRRIFASRSTVSWVEKNAEVDRLVAQAIISSLPEVVHPKLDWNAGNPRNFLGLAAALYSKPDVIVFSTLGMDPLGVARPYAYVKSKREEFFAVNVEWGIDAAENEDCNTAALFYGEQIWLGIEDTP